MNLYLFNNINDINDETYEKALEKLPPKRKEYTLKYNSENKRKLSVFTFYTLKYALMIEKNLTDFDIMLTRKGKPYILDCNFHFSLSHSKNKILAAVSNYPVGVDIEKIGQYNHKISERVCSEKELEILKNSEDKEDLFYKMWVQKEAYSKMTGNGFSEGFKKIETLNNPKTIAFRRNSYYIGIASDLSDLSDNLVMVNHLDLINLYII